MTDDGKQVPLQDDNKINVLGLIGFGFPRYIHGDPLIGPKTREVSFHAVFPDVVINMRFKVKDLMYNGVLEY